MLKCIYLDMKWTYIDLPDNYSTNEWKNLILIDGSSRITNFELKKRDFQFQAIFYTPLKFEILAIFMKKLRNQWAYIFKPISNFMNIRELNVKS